MLYICDGCSNFNSKWMERMKSDLILILVEATKQ